MTDDSNLNWPKDGPEKAPSHLGVSITSEMRKSYLDYAMSVIVSRAIPDLRDGLKPVHRRVLYAMYETNNSHDKPYRKSARPVGDVMGKYHPHGDAAIYDALVRMAQDFSMSLPLLDGQGNFGSLDGDSPAAMRYTEIRMAKPAAALLADIEKNTVDFQDNYDGKDREPTVLPVRFPNMLVNGASGIAVGMATNIPPHNLGEVIDATLALIENPGLSAQDLTAYLPAPDFPTGGLILGQSGARKSYIEGRGSVIIRAKTHIETINKDRLAIVITEIPYQVNKVVLIEKIAEAVRTKRIEGISHVQDESDRNGVRIVIELKRDATSDVVLNQLFRFTQMQTSFGCNMLALNNGRPEQLSLRDFLHAFILFRENVVTRRTIFDLNKARERSHILCGLAVAVANVDKIVAMIRASKDAREARENLIAYKWPAHDILTYLALIDDPSHQANEDGSYNLSETQARAILELRLQRLTALGVREVTEELESLAEKIKNFLAILTSSEKIRSIIRDELTEVKKQFPTPRRTAIVDWEDDMDDEDFIEREDMVVTISHGSYIKRTALADFRAQKRGGKGLSGMSTKEEDFVTTLFVANTHTPLLFFTTDGMVYKLKTWNLPLSGRTARGKAIVNILPINKGASIAAIMPVDIPEEKWSKARIMFATSAGTVRCNALSDFINVKSNGKIAMKFEGIHTNTTLINARICTHENDVFLLTRQGRAIRFAANDVRIFNSRSSIGNRGIRLAQNDSVVSMSVLKHFSASSEQRMLYLKMRKNMNEDPTDKAQNQLSKDDFENFLKTENLILTVSAEGLGKLSSSHDYPTQGRGGHGVSATDRNMRGGFLVAAFPVNIEDEIMLATSTGQSIRCPVQDISFQSRSAGGVKIFTTKNDENVVSVARIVKQNNEASSLQEDEEKTQQIAEEHHSTRSSPSE